MAARAGVARAPDLANAVAVPECTTSLLEVESSVYIDQRLRLFLPHAHHLRRLLLERHACEQVRDALLGGERWIAVNGGVRCGGVGCHFSGLGTRLGGYYCRGRLLG
ncbi:MAG TPA: hypothetical protein VL308_00115 [Gemmatimonadaceae bacterium]|nr:hypothetical protein [Gemmatimonadaceae bacterium]